MADPKPSGLRPPSIIGRPCSNQPPRPAIPPPQPRPSMNQMDHLWETHGRRLSEAGLRRGSDTSVVLTEDTDSFIIGDRVWVGGTKPGSIAYIGETQFAPGDWAGVVLDEPIGKNDGSVAGCRYFQCESKRGIFSRLTRLTRQPLDNFVMMSSMQKTPTTPPDSMKGSLAKSMCPSLNTSMTSLSSTVSQRDLKIGERVIVSSSQGSKTGVLRYLGITEFAPGEWCGVELDEPIGKNDGSVGDKRYFECRPKYGLFAPAHKVSRSPSSKRSMCMIHKPTGAALNSSLKRTGSRESLISLSSIASTASTAARTGISTARRPGLRTSTLARTTLQETLKEKQQEIEFLRRERDLERDRVTKAANQADQAEQSIVSIKQEYEQYREKMQKTVTEAESALTKLLEEKNALALQLEEEKRKCEDLLFRFEEESVNKDDIQVINTVNENRIRDLEKQLLEERERVAQLEHDSIILFKTEEELARLRNEVSDTSVQVKHQLEDLQNQNRWLEEIKASLEREVHEKSMLVEQCAAQIKEFESRLHENQKENVMHSESEENLRTELDRVTKVLVERNTLIENMKKEFESVADTLNGELQHAKETIENIKLENANEKESLISKYEKIVEEKENIMKVKTEELEIESKKQLEVQSIALEDLKAENIKQINKLSESFNEQLNMKDSKIKEVSMQLEQKTSETEKLMRELSTQIDLSKKKDEELNVALKNHEELNEKYAELVKQIQEYQSKAEENFKIALEVGTLKQQVNSYIATESETSTQLKKVSEELKVKEMELSELRSTTAAEIEELVKRYQGQIEEKSKYIEEVTADVSQKSELLSKLEKDIIELKSILATKDEEIKNLTEKISELQNALTLSTQTKTNLENELQTFKNNVETLNQQVASVENKILQVTAQKEKLESDIANLVSSSADSSEQLVKYNEDLRLKEKELDELRDKGFKSETTIKSLEGKLNNAELELSKASTLIQEQRTALDDTNSQLEKERKLNTELSDKAKQFEIENGELKEIINENEHIKNNLVEKSEKMLNLANELKNSKEEIFSLQKQISNMQAELAASQEETKNLQKIKSKLEADQSATRWSIEELTEKLATETENRSKLESLISEKDSVFQEIQNKYLELQKLNEALIVSKETTEKNLTTSLDTTSNEVKELKDKLNSATETIKIKEDAFIQMKKEVERTEAQILKLNDTIVSMKQEQTHNMEETKKVQEALSIKEKEVNDMAETKNSLEDKVKMLESQLKIIREELSVKSHSLQEMEHLVKELKNTKDESVMKLQSTLESEIKSKQIEFETVLQKNSELEQKQLSLQDLVDKQISDLNNKKAIIDKLTGQLKTLENTQTETLKAHEQTKNEEFKFVQNKLNEVNKEIGNLIDTKKSLEKLLRDREENIEILTNTIKNKEKEADKNMQNMMEKLNHISTESVQLKEANSNLERENKQLNVKWAEATNELKLNREGTKNNYDGAGGDMEQQIVQDVNTLKLVEESDTTFLRDQIDFLNSVIIDLRNKNDALTCKIKVLEMGVPANEADEYTQSTLKKCMTKARVFCDICDQFDLHETEDCPCQSEELSEPEKIAKRTLTERPYCENCEMFGHDIFDCDDAETF
ncbi:cytoplasmic linker protein 190 isoform X2 [Ptiloglossa arizonensis]|uniref:cytoplasmic linker protein 190 isoform X2 n=1 Tax=Ptiloglossa arizonensis TaxID=3350558 RepID=UPI003F9F3D64